MSCPLPPDCRGPGGSKLRTRTRTFATRLPVIARRSARRATASMAAARRSATFARRCLPAITRRDSRRATTSTIKVKEQEDMNGNIMEEQRVEEGKEKVASVRSNRAQVQVLQKRQERVAEVAGRVEELIKRSRVKEREKEVQGRTMKKENKEDTSSCVEEVAPFPVNFAKPVQDAVVKEEGEEKEAVEEATVATRRAPRRASVVANWRLLAPVPRFQVPTSVPRRTRRLQTPTLVPSSVPRRLLAPSSAARRSASSARRSLASPARRSLAIPARRATRGPSITKPPIKPFSKHPTKPTKPSRKPLIKPSSSATFSATSSSTSSATSSSTFSSTSSSIVTNSKRAFDPYKDVSYDCNLPDCRKCEDHDSLEDEDTEEEGSSEVGDTSGVEDTMGVEVTLEEGVTMEEEVTVEDNAKDDNGNTLHESWGLNQR